MFESLSGMEILTIAVVALIVFGPHRLPEMARTVGKYLRELRGAVRDLREGIEREVAPIREPITEIKKDLTGPVGDVKRTLTETADAAKTVQKDIESSVKDLDQPGTDPSEAAPSARWIAPEPSVGVSPGEVWEGMNDPLPEQVIAPQAEELPPEDPGRSADSDEEDGTSERANQSE
ncbi:MAG: twin-arginine translocase TatA/TatE family subunit [bacterium]|nr:twin-arginine translocase TatA/TatE family subunit [bacterium]